MARYGSGKEDFDREAAAIRERRLARQAMIAKEEQYQRAIAVTAGLESETAARRAIGNQAKREALEVAKREAAVAGVTARDVNVETGAIQRNTEARRRNAALRAQQAKLARPVSLALTGARDPAFPAAHRLAQAQGGTLTQYRIRQQLEGVGSRRASALQAAVERGFRPQTEPVPAFAPLTRVQAADLELERAKAEAARQTRNLASVVKGSSAPAEEAAALAARDAARARVASANDELKSARNEIEARGTNAAAAQREADAHRRAATAAEKPVPPPPPPTSPRRADIIRHPTLYGTGAGTAVDYTDLERQAARRIVTREPVRETGAAGQYGGGDEKYDRAYERNREARAQALAKETAAAEKAAEATRQHTAAVNQERLATAQANAQRVDAYMARSAAASQAQARAVRDSGVAFGTVSNAMHRHGALTTEFINAAARGETTLRELGNQSLATAGKFAGWTAAGAALYTAVDAVRQLGAGAIRSSDGVAQLQRVIPGADRDATISAFAGLSSEFNVDIETAADAVYRMGQRFHTLPEAVEAARSALYSFKTGEVDVATSTENLLAIVSGFGLEATELTAVYDQVNEAQNRFGVKIGETEAGLAKAAGAFRNSGGDLNFLLGLFVAINRATNRSGQEIGTGLARGVSQIRLPSHQEALRQAGVDVDPENLQTTIQSALQVAQQPGADINAIASAILGNQYARLLAPVLKDQTTLNQALAETAPAAAQGSAQKELQRVLSQVSEQAKAVGIGLQNIGAELARSGALIPFAGALKALNLMLDATGALLHTFNVLPTPLRQSLAVLGQMAVVVAGLRKFGATDRLAGTRLDFIAQPDRRLKTYATKGLRDAQQESFRELESAARREYTAAAFAQRERMAITDYEKTDEFRSTRGLDAADERRQVADQKHIMLQQRAAAAETARVQAMDETRRASAGATMAEKDLKAIRAVPPSQLRQYLANQQIAVPAQLDAPNTEGTRRVLPMGFMPGGDADIDRLVPRTAPPPTRSPRIERAATAARLRIAAMAVTMEEAGRAHRGLGPAARGLERGANAVVTGSASAVTFMGRATGAIRGVPGGLRRMGTGLANLARSLGPLDLALIAILAGAAINSQVDKLNKDVKNAEKFIDEYTGKTEKQRASLQDRAAKIRQRRARPPDTKIDIVAGPDIHIHDEIGRTMRERVQDATETVNDIFNPVKLFGSTIPKAISGDYETPYQRRKRIQDELLKRDEERQEREAAQARALSRGEPRREMVASDLIGDIRRTSQDRNAGLITMAEFDRQMAVYANEARVLLAPSKGETAAVKSAMARALSTRGRGGTQYADVIRGLDAEGVESEMEAVISQIEALGGTATNLDNLTQLYMRAVQLHGGKNDADSIKKLTEARKATFGAIEANAQEEVKAGLESATTEAGRRGVYTRVRADLSDTRDRLRQRAAQAREALNEAYRRRRDNRERQAAAPVPLAIPPDPITGRPLLGAIPQTNAPALQRRARKLAADIRRFRQNVQRFQKELDAANRELARIAGMMKEEAYADREEGRQVDLAYKQSLTTDPVRRAALATLAAQRQARDAQRTFGKGRRQKEAQTAANEARNAENEARQQAAEEAEAERKQRADDAKAAAEEARQNAIERVRLLGELAAARAGGDPVKSAQAQVKAAQAALRMAGSGNERLQGLVDLANANNALEDALKDRENARLDFLASLTTDPLRKAQIEVKKANVNLRGTTGTERFRALADRNAKRQELIATRVAERREEIDFNLQMERITNDVAISQYESLLKTKGITKSTRRQILQQIKQLQEDEGSGEELNVGNIKLPTLYDIRRMAQQGTNTSPVNVQQNTSYNVNIQNPGDVEAFGAHLDRVHGGSTRAALRSAGYRG